MTDPPRTIAERYEVVRQLGRGGFATTWLCRPKATREAEPERLVAIKELRIGASDAPEDGNPAWKHVELFEREAKVLAMLRHESVPRVIEFFEHPREGGGLGLYLVQEFVEAPSLRQRLEHGPLLGSDEIERLVHGLLDVLEYLHGRAPPVFHRDVKPSNILIRDDGRPFLIDFGGVCLGWRPPTQAGTTVVGTFGYMPPEQLLGHVGATTDLYALGATLLELASGMAPHEFPWDTGRIEVPDNLPADPRLVRLINALLEPAPRKRPASAAAARAIYVSESSPSVALATTTAASAPVIAVMGGDGPRYVDVGPPPRDPDGPFADVYLDLVDPYAIYLGVRNRFGRGLLMLGYGAITFGIVPLWYALNKRQRAKRYRRLFIEGSAVLGRIVAVTTSAFEDAITSNVKFGYQVEGVEYRGFIQFPNKLASYWSEGDPVTVLYDPGDPTDACFVFRRVVR